MKSLKKYKTGFYYITSSIISFVVDLLTFTIILYFLKPHFASAFIISSYLGRAISCIINYILNKKYVFKYEKGKKDKTFISYFTLVLVNITISGTIGSKLYTLTHFNETLIKSFIDGVIFIANYFIQKLFIFNNNKKNNIGKYFLPLISFIAIFIKLTNKGISFNYEHYEYINMIIYLIILYYLYLKVFKEHNNIKSINILSAIFTIFMIVGYSYEQVYSPRLLFNSDIHILITLIKAFGFYYLIENLIYSFYEFITNHKFKDGISKLGEKFNKRPFLYSFIILLIVYGFYLIFYYPGILNPDNGNQIKEVLGLHTRYLDSVILLNENVTLTNFNPIIHTLLIGNLFKLGLHFGSANLGIFMYIIIQELIVIVILSYSIYFLHEEKIKPKYLLVILAIYTLIPIFPFFAMTAVKDTLYSMFVLLYIIRLYQYIKYDYTFKNYIILFIIMVLVILLRNNGIFLILMSFPFAAIFKKKYLKRTLVLSGVVVLFLICYNYSLPLFDIPNTSVREVLSVPFQQTARYVWDYPEDVTKEEHDIIDKILNFEDLAERYDPELSDAVKNEYNIYTTDDDLKDYFKVWGKMFFKHPDAYINATISNNYGYLYPNTYSWYIYYKLNKILPEAGYNYHYNNLEDGRLFLKNYAYSYKYIPVLQYSVSCGFYTWMYVTLAVILFLNKKKELLLIITPAFAMILMNLIGPANTYFRYVLPYAISLPVILIMVIKEVNKSIIIKDKSA